MFRLVVLIAASAAAVQGACQEGCKVPVTHYKEIGCEPVYEHPACCPQHYDCSKFFAQAPDKCHFKGVVYSVRENIPNNVTGELCAASCHCSRGEWQDINCANIECPDLWHPIPLGPGCFHAYKLEGCCSHKTECPPFDKLATCEVNGTKYYEGQRFEAPGIDRELSCVCKPNFQGKFEKPFCREINCGTELRYTSNIRKKCAPVYYGTQLECPIQWECPQDGDNIVANKEGNTSVQKCNYGQEELNIGDQLALNRSIHSPVVNCECRIPPLVTCIQEPYPEQ